MEGGGVITWCTVGSVKKGGSVARRYRSKEHLREARLKLQTALKLSKRWESFGHTEAEGESPFELLTVKYSTKMTNNIKMPV